MRAGMRHRDAFLPRLLPLTNALSIIIDLTYAKGVPPTVELRIPPAPLGDDSFGEPNDLSNSSPLLDLY